MHMERTSSTVDTAVRSTQGESSDAITTPKKRLAKRKHSEDLHDPCDRDMADFTVLLQQRDQAHIAFEERRFAKDLEQREKDREERRTEREAAKNFELQHLSL